MYICIYVYMYIYTYMYIYIYYTYMYTYIHIYSDAAICEVKLAEATGRSGGVRRQERSLDVLHGSEQMVLRSGEKLGSRCPLQLVSSSRLTLCDVPIHDTLGMWQGSSRQLHRWGTPASYGTGPRPKWSRPSSFGKSRSVLGTLVRSFRDTGREAEVF